MSKSDSKNLKNLKPNSKLILGLLFIVFLGPFGFALNIHKKNELASLRHNNIGQLINPVKHSQDLQFSSFETQHTFTGEERTGKWQFLYIPPLSCHEACHDNIAMMGQIHHALNKSAYRLERMLVLLEHHQLAEFKAYDKKYFLSTPSYEQTLGSIHVNQRALAKRDQMGEYYLIDPKGHIMMYYTGNTPPKGILKDLNKLMKASKIG